MNHERRHSVHTEIIDWICGEVLDDTEMQCVKLVKFRAKIEAVNPAYIHECPDGHTHVLEKKYPYVRLTAFPGSQIVYGELAL